MDDVLLLISGASGAGKTSVRNAIAADLGPAVEAVELCHPDTVPAAPDLAWRQRMAERAVQRAGALEKCGRHLLLAGDPVAPGEVLAAPSAPSVDIAVCLLDVTEKAQRERLRRRGDPEALLPHHVAFADWLRRHAANPAHMPHVLSTGGWEEMQWSRMTDLPRDRWRIKVIDGSSLSIPGTSHLVLQWIRDAIAGRAGLWSGPLVDGARRIGRTAPPVNRASTGPTMKTTPNTAPVNTPKHCHGVTVTPSSTAAYRITEN